LFNKKYNTTNRLEKEAKNKKVFSTFGKRGRCRPQSAEGDWCSKLTACAFPWLHCERGAVENL